MLYHKSMDMADPLCLSTCVWIHYLACTCSLIDGMGFADVRATTRAGALRHRSMREYPPHRSHPCLQQISGVIGWDIITNLIALQLGCVRTTQMSAPLLGWVMTIRMYSPLLGRVMTHISWQGSLKPYNYIQDDANTLNECRGMVEWCEVRTTSSSGGVLLRLRYRPALGMHNCGLGGLRDHVFAYICYISCT